ncbi:BrnT family toxin [Candidatus Amesbacteria bacterium]|nr:BrnT family toxin [Candidatus Amesbacteria bacterium]MBI2587281.1 BrnT family toxin [Candidatus Amesbacteria bacterium]
MTVKVNFTSFQWDKGNLDKSYAKHSITPQEAEEVFLDESLITQEDVKHSQKEERFTAIGKTTAGELLFAVYTHRNGNIRVISIRKANKKEKEIYEKT